MDVPIDDITVAAGMTKFMLVSETGVKSLLCKLQTSRSLSHDSLG